MKNEFIQDYIADYTRCLNSTEHYKKELLEIHDCLVRIKKEQAKKIIVIGNGGSAAIASHFSVDMTKTANIRTVCFNESALLTCFSNDFEYSNAFAKAIDYYGDEGDVLIAISSSGQSPNIINACSKARKKQFSTIITLSGFKADNPLRQSGDINLWIDSSHYNMVENTHQFWALLFVDMVRKFEQ